MKSYFLALLILLSACCSAQKSLYNIPTSEIVDSNHYFFQQQINFSRLGLVSSTTITKGLPYRFELGLTLLSLNYNFSRSPDFLRQNFRNGYGSTDLLVNYQKVFNIGEHLRTGIGGWTGINFSGDYENILSNFNYLNLAVEPRKHYKLFLGGYLTNPSFNQTAERLGVLAGTELKVAKDLNFQADYLSIGNITTLGFGYNLSHIWELSAGVQIPVNRGDIWVFALQLSNPK